MADEHLAYAAVFVAARLDEAEAAAKAAQNLFPGPWESADNTDSPLPGAVTLYDSRDESVGVIRGSYAANHIARCDPGSALRQIAGNRTAVAACTRAAEADPYSPAGVLALAVLEAMSTGWEHPQRPFVPDWTVSPGELLRKELEARGIDPGDVLGAQRIIDGTLAINALHANVIADHLGTGPEMWLNAQRLHDAAILRGANDGNEEEKR